jgi:cyanophycinase-like exopeptidase
MALGKVVFISSGETSSTGGQVFRDIASSRKKGLRISVLETPAGFELNSDRVAGRVADSILLRTGEFAPRIDVIAARRKGTPHSPDSPAVTEPLRSADLIFLGAGSPTYAVRQLRGSLAWRILLGAWQQGADLALASAAALAMGKYALPVYEIFKAGEDPEWKPGLDLLGPLGWKLAVISHWNNAEGGKELDTSRCFIGRERFELLRSALPAGAVVLGLDEHTSAVLDWSAGTGTVEGKGTITILREGRTAVHGPGSEFPLAELGEYRIPAEPFGVEAELWDDIRTRRAAASEEPLPPPEVAARIRDRERVRRQGDYAKADALRAEIERLGWKVMDTPDGPTAKPVD